MGYELYITRADNFWETNEQPILEDEWENVANADPDLEKSQDDWYQRSNEDGSSEQFHPWIIKSHPERQPLWYMDGAINTKNPDEAARKKLFDLSQKLNAKVLGEEGETYNAEGNQHVITSVKKPWWKIW